MNKFYTVVATGVKKFDTQDAATEHAKRLLGSTDRYTKCDEYVVVEAVALVKSPVPVAEVTPIQ